MKTAKQIQELIDKKTAECLELNLTTKQHNKLNYILVELRQLRSYLETSPSPESIENQIRVLKAKIEIINNSYNQWRSNSHKIKDPLRAINQYHLEMGLPKLKKQLETLEFIWRD